MARAKVILVDSDVISHFIATGHIYDLDESAEQFLPTFYKEPGFRIMYNEEMKRLYVQKFKETEKKENE